MTVWMVATSNTVIRTIFGFIQRCSLLQLSTNLLSVQDFCKIQWFSLKFHVNFIAVLSMKVAVLCQFYFNGALVGLL